MYTGGARFTVAAQVVFGAELEQRPMKALTEVCPLCAGSGWKVVPDVPERGVTRCDCQLMRPRRCHVRGGADSQTI